MVTNVEQYEHVIVGVGHFGYRAASTILDTDPHASLLLINEEDEAPYRRKELNSSFLNYDPEEHRFPPIWGKRKCVLARGVSATRIEPGPRIVHLSDGRVVRYGSLFLGVGARPRRLEIPGADLPGVSHVWCIGDMIRTSRQVPEFSRALVVGSGILAIDTIGDLLRLGKTVTAVARGEAFMSRRMSRAAGVMLREGLERAGAEILCNQAVTSIDRDSGRLTVSLSEGTRTVDRVFVTIGVQPRVELARDAGLETRTGVMVDEYLRTSDPNIYCGGDAAEFADGTVTQKEHAASRMGNAAALNALGIETRYVIDKTGYGLVVDGRYFMAVGKPDNRVPGVEEVERHTVDGYEAFYFKDDRLVGASAVYNSIGNRYGELISREVAKPIAMKILRLGQPVDA